MSTLSVSGLVSGLDTDSIIQALVDVRRAPITLLEEQKKEVNTQLTAFQTLETLLSSLESTVNSLNSVDDFRAKDGSSSDESVVTVTATGSANTGSFNITVNQIAQAETFVADGMADKDTTPVASASGTLSFTVGSGSAVEISVTASTTLEELASSINSANAGVTATVIDDGSDTNPYRLVLRSDTTGSDGNITFNQNDTDLTFTNTQADQDASITLDGIDITSSSNTITEVINGVTINVVASGTTSFTISNDTSTVTSKINEFVEAYNAVKDFINQHSTYDTVTEEKGALFGDSTLFLISTKMRQIIGSGVSGLDDTYTALSQIGVKTNSSGLLEVDSDELSDALTTDFIAVSRIFIQDDDTSTDGVLQQLSDYLDYVTDPVEGLLDVKQDTLIDTIEGLQDTIDYKEYLLEKYEETLIQKYASLEELISETNATAEYLTSSLTSLTNS